MKRRIFCFLLAALIALAVCGCKKYEDDAISGTGFNPMDYVDESGYTRYENALHGIIIEYPGAYERVGNFELDGYISFEGDDKVIEVYIPDAENNDILTSEEYTNEILDIWYIGEESHNVKYGKTSGFKAVQREDGKIRTDFVVKGVDAFYRFAFTADEEGFTEEDPVFQYVMSSIRIDDGIYNRLTRMASRYKVLLEYATSMQYITDVNYANHCLNSFDISKDVQSKAEAISTLETVKAEVNKIITHEREKDEGYDEWWNDVLTEAEVIIKNCDEAIAEINADKIADAQTIARTKFSYELSDKSAKFIAMINAEIAEY